jgi:hypothetical protein
MNTMKTATKALLPLLRLLVLLSYYGCHHRQNNGGGGGGGVVMAQEAPNPRLQAKPFASFSPLFRQDLCTRSSNLNSADDIGSLLQGVALNTAMGLGEFVKLDHQQNGSDDNNVTLNRDYPGLLPRIMDEICWRAGCTWRNSYTVLGALPPNTTWSELLIWTTETYDISVDWWMRSAERMRNGVTFIEPW